MNKEQFIRSITENRIIRICTYPLIMAKHSNAKKKYAISGYGESVKKFKNLYKGKRCFIVGNGPSLKLKDLDILDQNNEICFGMNRIYDLFDKTEWRPTFYFCYDRDFIRSEFEKIISIPAKTIFVEYSKAPKNKKVDDNRVVYYLADYVFGVKRGTAITDHVCTELEVNTSFVTNTTHLCLEFAFYMGFEEIYLIGMDHDYSFGYGKNHAEGIKEGKHNDSKHNFNCNLDVSTRKYKQYRQFADNNGIKIFNASEGGKLNVFERRKLSDVYLK